ncbi:RagB/SusD family nutrient uptake outer membrane protein [Croceivirga thetidis]|uniref:RagB/SusD family nutrient uptake outer membrane protein n=1 Tax=Croceivirga thetidis TaxID=2721623 RepID=A0ABX1GRA1_9FLAO|nr:RagB/SusD family nutrient uptake outer membrane protein [Croceivirga thetidis]NKI32465.1 RagB/SusD family nutrient uptake outer membrane protein [Croceivirga thetidis]
MKSLRFNIGCIIFLIIIACDDNLDLVPPQDLTTENVLSDEANIERLLVAAYDLAGQQDLFSGRIQLASELLANSGELAWRGTFFWPAEFNRKQMTSNNFGAQQYWIVGYGAINQANIILNNLAIVEDAQQRERIEGEAKFIRGLVYFELARLFALPYEQGLQNTQLGLPILLEGVINAGQISFPSRNTLEEVYQQAIQDLSDAINLLPDANGVFADRYAAQAVLARLFLQQGNFANARDAAHNVIQNSGHALATNYALAFNNTSDGVEDIFSWQITTQDGFNDFNTFWATIEFGGRSVTADVTIEPPYFELFTSLDDRSSFFYEGNSTFVTSKWQGQFANIPFLRMAEMHLVRAECNLRLGTAVGLSPEDDINLLRNRANAVPITDITLEEVLIERRVELAFEGHRLHDIKRLGQSVNNLFFNSDFLVLPIPQRELDANPELEPNPGYNN